MSDLAQLDPAFKQMFSMTTDAAFIEIGGLIADVNEAGLHLYRSTRPEIVDRLVTELVPEQYRSRLSDRPRLVEQGRERPRVRPEEILRPDGTRARVSVRSCPIDLAGQPAVLILLRPIDPLDAETDQQNRQRRRDHTFTDVSLRLAMADEHSIDSTIRWILKSIANSEGADRAYVIDIHGNRQLISCTHEWTSAAFEPQIDYLQDLPSADFPWSFGELLAGRTVHVPDLSAIPDDGRAERESFGRFGVHSLLQVPMIVAGEVTGLVGFNAMERSITWSDDTIELVRRVGDTIATALTRRDALAAIEAARTAAEQANRAKTSFLSRMSHELRTPLNAVLGFTELMLLDDGRSDDDKRLLSQVLSSGHHLRALVEDVLDISRIEAGGLTTSIEAVDLGDVVRESLTLIDAEGLLNGLAIERAEQLQGKSVLADRQRMQQVVTNIVSNACKYNRPGGRVTITATTNADFVDLVVADTGIGIPADAMSRVFEPFDRLGREEGPVDGTGVGLSLTKMLVELMGGHIAITSTEGSGTVVTVQLPAAKPSHRSPNHHSVGPNTQLVLGVEDNEASALLLQHVVEREPGLSYVSTSTITGALAAIEEREPALILLDLHLADGRGQDLLTRVKLDPLTRSIPVIIITADNDPIVRSQMLAAGASEYMSKPVDISRLRASIRKTLDMPAEPPV